MDKGLTFIREEVVGHCSLLQADFDACLRDPDPNAVRNHCWLLFIHDSWRLNDRLYELMEEFNECLDAFMSISRVNTLYNHGFKHRVDAIFQDERFMEYVMDILGALMTYSPNAIHAVPLLVDEDLANALVMYVVTHNLPTPAYFAYLPNAWAEHKEIELWMEV